ncbi:MAG: ABC transporter ATP-binding protein [Sphingobacteriia bacterium]|nr:ABC transporter ATP-binding protein [Sphingobacteriia bacterium]
MVISCESVNKSYGVLQVLKEVSLVVNKGEIIAITGPSGAGKSTLLHILGTLDKPDSGRLIIDGADCISLSENGLSSLRNRKIGFVFQFHHLLPEFTAIENVIIPGLIAGRKEQEVRTEGIHLLKLLGLESRVSHKPSEMSGGEQQRVAVARALINKPAVVLADEPSGNLDSQAASELHDLFFRLREEINQTFIIVTHNDQLAARADRVIKLKDGRIEL